jgi:CRISPR-associated endonuclease/helicase Cas3
MQPTMTSYTSSELRIPFIRAFEELTGHTPYWWQEELFSLFVSAKIPTDIGLPTGAGKTSIMAIWLIAVAAGARISRRLVWVVDRRVVVDQATTEAELLASRVNAPKDQPGLLNLKDALASLSLTGLEGDVLTISTLRGEREDNREWSKNPSRPAIIIGTVDMIGSRLLFSGYGDGRSRRATHAGLLGHDALLINDEAHLTPAFASLAGRIANIQKDTGDGRRFCIARLSATHVNGHLCWPESLDEDRKRESFRKIFEAPKRLKIVPSGKGDSKLLELAIAPGPARTLIFLRKPEDVRKVATALERKLGCCSERVLCLTGTMRGFERDQLIRHPTFQDFAARKKPDQSSWIIATSAAEVGVDISSDRLITDLDTADHLIQRFGRLNRFGETEGHAYLLLSDAEQNEDKQKDPRKGKALTYFKELLKISDDLSTARLFASSPPPEACSEPPLEAPLHDWLVDVWSQTTLGSHPARPAVEPWLHGKQDNYPETYIAWREDVRDLTADRIAEEDLASLLNKYPVLAHERLREPTNLLQEKFAKLTHWCNPATRVLCLKPDGSVAVLAVSYLADKRQAEQLRYSQLILPPGCGWLNQGMFSPEPPDANGSASLIPYDLAGCELDETAQEAGYNAKRACYRATQVEDGWQLQRLGGVHAEKREQPILLTNLETELNNFAAECGWRLLFRLDADATESKEEAETAVLLYFKPAVQKAAATSAVFLQEHSDAVAAKAAGLAEKLDFSDGEIARALVLAGKCHDLGKRAEIWQLAAGNRNGGPALAKSTVPMRLRMLAGFRHELASLRDAEREFAGEPEPVRNLALHLIAAHHGHARPSFEKKAYDRQYNQKENERLAIETAQRFGRLQRRYGAWGLAYLESVFKAADALASADAEEPDA